MKQGHVYIRVHRHLPIARADVPDMIINTDVEHVHASEVSECIFMHLQHVNLSVVVIESSFVRYPARMFGIR